MIPTTKKAEEVVEEMEAKYTAFEEPIYAKLPEEPKYAPGPTFDLVKNQENPHDYYSIPGLGLEANDIIEALEMDFSKGSAMKYLVRAGRKPGQSELKDLAKAVDFLQKRIAFLEKKGMQY